MLKLSQLRKNVQRDVAAAKRNGDTLPDSRARKMQRFVNGVVIETLEIPMTEHERRSQVESILAKVEGTSVLKEDTEISTFMEFGLRDGGRDDGLWDGMGTLDDESNAFPEPEPVSSVIFYDINADKKSGG